MTLHRPNLNFLIQEENLVSFFISVITRRKTGYWGVPLHINMYHIPEINRMKNFKGVRKQEGWKTNCEGSFKNLSRYYTVVVLVLYSYSFTFQYTCMLRNCRSFTSGKSARELCQRYTVYVQSCYSKGKKKSKLLVWKLVQKEQSLNATLFFVLFLLP